MVLVTMDNNDNENCCYSHQQQQPSQSLKAGGGAPIGISKGAIPKASGGGVAKYQQNHLNNNNNNVAEQENLMPAANGVAGAKSENHCYPVALGAAEMPVVLDQPADAQGAASNGLYENESSAAQEPPRALNSENCNGTTEATVPADESSIEDLAAKALGSDEGDQDGDFSDDNNSLGNLSYISENGLIEEIILLPNNIYSDDENGSASDDCIYAYRGDDNVPALLEYRDQPADDETDFLEMDFDPEPSSELENLLEHQEIDVSSYQLSRTSERRSHHEIDDASLKSPLMENDTFLVKKEEPPDEADFARGEVTASSSGVRNTGAIPKKLPPQVQVDYAVPGPSSSRSSMREHSKNLRLDLKLCTDVGDVQRYHYPYYQQRDFDEDDDDDDDDDGSSCLDCTEKELLMQTKQNLSIHKICRSCHSRNTSQGQAGDYHQHHEYGPTTLNSSTSETDLLNIRAEQIVQQALNKINELKATPPSVCLSRSMEDLCVELDSVHRDQEVPDDFGQDLCSDNTVTIYTLNCGELTIIEALTRIGVAPNLDVLRQYFSETYDVDTSKMNIPQYLLYMSKRDCNFRKLIDAIKSCCEDPLDVQYYPLDPFSDIPEVVQINSSEIARRWHPNTNLRQLINFKHKHFHTLNVLGKIVNILRQPSRGKHTNQTINIPQYYKSGSITITRLS
ncbi:uncharacterized protein LOC129744474 [Uranotaenia lowii]|uniref:uncharacterized protein LOC129744474 n=1 Tax=Uranotaenia lowii TaxID=190385 RepID=UPI002479FF91|nr:uncharacterized protein LOC129744474 [Uranotaenia lowii]